MTPVFSGRVIFDHLEKTGGQAINAWLRRSLGNGCVTGNLIGRHRELIKKWGGDYSVISGHIRYDAAGLDPRYKYCTILRDPVERAISYIYFIVNNFHPDDLPEWRSYERFIESDGEIIDNNVLYKIPNYYIDHFAAARSPLHRRPQTRLADALGVVEEYDVWGFYERMPDFLADFAALLQIEAPERVGEVNKTLGKPKREDISRKLVARLEELNHLDIQFYRILHERHDEARALWRERKRAPAPVWVPYERPAASAAAGGDLTILSVTAHGAGGAVAAGAPIDFEVEFTLGHPVGELLIGTHLVDIHEDVAFGTNTRMLDTPVMALPAGRHVIHYRIRADLPEGKYQAGFAFLEPAADGMRTLGWFDGLVTFDVRIARPVNSIGYCGLPASFDHHQLADSRHPRESARA